MLVAYTFPPFGRETVIPLAIAAGIPWAYVLLSVFVEDFLAVAAYPLIPTPFKGTGTFSESIITRAVGLDKKRALVAVSIGAAGADILTTLLSSLLIQTLLIPLFH